MGERDDRDDMLGLFADGGVGGADDSGGRGDVFGSRDGRGSRDSGADQSYGPMRGSAWSLFALARWLRCWWPSLAFTLVALLLVATIPPDASVDRGNAQATLALPFLLAAATVRVWRRAGAGLPGALRIRSLHRKVCWRLALACVYGSLFALWVSSMLNQAADDADFGSGTWISETNWSHLLRASMSWLFIAAAVLVLLEPLAWLLWPASLRREVRDARASVRLARLDRAQLRTSRSFTGVGRRPARRSRNRDGRSDVRWLP